MVENYEEDNSNMTNNSLSKQPPLCGASIDNHNQDVGNADMEMNDCELVGERSSEKEETVHERYMSGNSSPNGEDLRQINGKSQEQKIMEEQDSELEDNNKSNKENIDESHKSKSVPLKSSSSQKKSKNQLKEERMKIHSETHRLMREREISIPYHVPKKRTLKEFLARKKNRANVPLNMPSSKMLEIWKDIEESTKNAFEFFKSDSESDVESCNETEKNRKVKTNQGKKNSKRKSCKDSDSSNNNVENNSNTIDSVNNINENLNSNLTNGKLDCEGIKGDDNHADNDDNAVFMCDDNLIEGSDLAGGSGRCLTDVQEVEDKAGGGDDNSNDGEDTSNLVMDLNHTENENPEIANNAEEQQEKYARERTSEWVKSIPTCEKLQKQNKKEILLQKLNPKLLKITPKLSGEPDSFIDLENDKNSIEIGAKNLKKRFLENCMAPRNKTKTDVELIITASEKCENGEINVATEKLIYTSGEVMRDPDLEKPGAKIQRLREELKKKIEEKWEEEENRKKMEELEIEEENKKKAGEQSEVEDEEELLEDDEMEECSETEESEPEEDDVPLTENKKKKNCFIDNEAEESDCDEESGNEGGDELDDNDNEGEEGAPNDNFYTAEENSESVEKDGFRGNEYDSQISLIPPYQPGGGMLHGGSELTQNDEDISLPKNVLSPALRLSLEFSPSTKNAGSQQAWDIDLESSEESNAKNNFVPYLPENKNFDLTDAYEFCSGKFPGEGDESQDCHREIGKTGINSQELITPIEDCQVNSISSDDLIVKETREVDEETESGKKKRSRLKVFSDVSDDEIDRPLDDLNELEDITKGRLSSDDSSEKSIPIGNRGRRKNLVFSDEEDDNEVNDKFTEESEEENEPQDEENSSQSDEEDPLADEVGREVEYDSEEAEIVNMGEYFEKEAELSGSEWSGDEDERDLDEFEMEDGDEDKLDEKKVRSELEKIHMRTLLDDDAREVRLLQELLFEDGDLFEDGPKRERNFRWKNLGTYFEDDANDGNDPELCQGQEDLEEDEETRKIRHEKELFLLQMKSKREEMGIDDEENGTSLLKRGKVIIESSSLTATKKVSQTVRTELDEFSFKTPFALTNKRGSFLSRNEEFLARLAKFTSSTTDNIHGPKHSKNFIFASKDPDKEVESTKENSQPKRKNSSFKGDQARNKKMKLDDSPTSSKISILDRLT